MTAAISLEKAGRILIADTDSMSGELLQFKFEDEGFDCDIVHSADELFDMDLTDYSLLLVDLMDSDYNGLMVTQAVKRNPDTFNMPVIILSAHSSEDDIVAGLDAGADDYITKPFSARELVARIRSVIRRRVGMRMRRVSTTVRYNDLVLDISAGMVYIDGNQLQITRTEYIILAMMMRNKNTFFDRSEIRHEAWENEDEVSDRAVDTNISRLRKKLGDYGRHIVNRQGFGYGFVD